MEETKKNDVQKKNWFAGLKSEFQKIVWLDKKSLGKQTVAVLVVSVILGAIIAVLDLGIQYGVDFLVNLYEGKGEFLWLRRTGMWFILIPDMRIR